MGFLSRLIPDSFKMYAIKPTIGSEQNYPHEIYTANLFGVLAPKTAGDTDHRYSDTEAAKFILECLSKGSRVYVPKQTILPPIEEGGDVIVETHDHRKQNLLFVLNQETKPHSSHVITNEEVKLIGPAAYESYIEIKQVPNQAA